MTAAEHAEAGTLAAVSAYRLAHVFIRRRQMTQARDLTTGAAGALHRSGGRDDPERMSVVGVIPAAVPTVVGRARDTDRPAQAPDVPRPC